MKKLFVVLTVFLAFTFAACTENDRAKNWGGTSTMNLPINTKLVNVTWKDSDLWYVTRPMRIDEKPETYEFKEQSSLGIMSGTVIFVESKK